MTEKSGVFEILIGAFLMLYACGGSEVVTPGGGGAGGTSEQDGSAGGSGSGASGVGGGSAGHGGVDGSAGSQGGSAGAAKQCGTTTCSASACCTTGDACGIIVGTVSGACVTTQQGRLDATCPIWKGGEITLPGCCLTSGYCGFGVSSDLCFSASQVMPSAPPVICHP